MSSVTFNKVRVVEYNNIAYIYPYNESWSVDLHYDMISCMMKYQDSPNCTNEYTECFVSMLRSHTRNNMTFTDISKGENLCGSYDGTNNILIDCDKCVIFDYGQTNFDFVENL